MADGLEEWQRTKFPVLGQFLHFFISWPFLFPLALLMFWDKF